MSKGESPIKVIARERANLDYHHGALAPAVGVQSFQVLRACRESPDLAEGTGWTYNHAPMLAYWRNRFYLEYLSNPTGEHIAPGHTLLTTSDDGRCWATPKVVFPTYDIRSRPGSEFDAEMGPVPRQAIMHQRMGFYVSGSDRLLVLGFYGFSPKPNNLPFDRRGIGRVVREINEDGSFGPIYFIRYNRHAGWNESNTNYPSFETSDDSGFIDACRELLADRLVTQQWKEEHGDADELITVKGNYKAFCYYTLPDGRVAGLWKWSLAGITSDRGHSWDWVGEAPSIENAGAKIWGQRTADGRYALVYNPTTNNKHRWPLAVVTSDDGLTFDRMLLAAGEVPPRRYYGANFKDYGQNYVRGIREGNGSPPDGAVWIAYSMNKEDIWVTSIPVPIVGEVTGPVDETFDELPAGPNVRNWNTYSPLWAPVDVAEFPSRTNRSLRLRDRDPYDYARAERVFAESPTATVELRVLAKQSGGKPLYIELWDRAGQIPVRVVLDTDGVLKLHHGRTITALQDYEPDTWYDLKLRVNAARHRCEVSVDGKLTGTEQSYQGEAAVDAGWYFLASVDSVCRLVLRTGPVRRTPHVDTEILEVPSVANPEIPLAESVYYVNRVSVS